MGKTKTHIRRTKLMVEEKLIESVRKRPFLYMKSHPHHGNRIMAACVWKKIYEEIGSNDIVSSGDDCADLWGSIWAQYLAFKRKVERGSLSESGKRVYFRHEIAMRECVEGQKQRPESSDSVDGTEAKTPSEDPEENISEEDTFQQYSNLSSCSALSVESKWKAVSLPGNAGTDGSFPSNSIISAAIGSASNSSIASASAPPSFKFIELPKVSNGFVKRTLPDWPDEPINLTTKTVNHHTVPTNTLDEYDLFGATIAAKFRKINKTDSKRAAELMFKVHELIYYVEKSVEDDHGR